ncbi:IlGF domain-containing protein [Aphelenchoides fujianensis]|nr:IlGF domain-containing protein [Aphelenchoides fujianensis]
MRLEARWTSCARLLAALLLLLAVAAATAESAQLDERAINRTPGKPNGGIRMCPPGGEAFTTAWQLTCGMRRKRAAGFLPPDAIEKRSDRPTYRPLSLTEMMKFCCRYGCSFRDLAPYCDPFGTWDSR